MPRSLLRTSALNDVYLILNDGEPFKPKRRYRKRQRGGMSPTIISSAYIHKRLGIKV